MIMVAKLKASELAKHQQKKCAVSWRRHQPLIGRGTQENATQKATVLL
jgi:hypothetical protein